MESKLCNIMGTMGLGWATPSRGEPPALMVVLLKVNRPSGDL